MPPTHPFQEPPLGRRAVAARETGHGVTLAEPYRSFVAEVANGSSLGPAEDGQSFWLLVTTGPHRGEVWMVADVGVTPVPTTGAAWGFAEWVEQWRAGQRRWS
ncbi:hypothetical protein GCM10020229_04930 [Kitasatospora albolonga]|uniref:hypothetical protein n=1 Tax=Kitasatospora albolonga TaxID=68173 RepID=UPI0031E82F03